MIILHGTYDNGKIEIREKDLPNVKSEVEISLSFENNESESDASEELLLENREELLKEFGKLHFGKELDKMNIRDLAYD
ncbi:MAG: hypothetical protein A2Y33_06545 [Spirochaetes bacterium GWF1_51_8]|nr:MAG: hypothetical protein A2Y33_06545 [Spirochaetes bacterium GWF1_51_8]